MRSDFEASVTGVCLVLLPLASVMRVGSSMNREGLKDGLLGREVNGTASEIDDEPRRIFSTPRVLRRPPPGGSSPRCGSLGRSLISAVLYVNPFGRSKRR
jgi:hypothetical protein